MELMLGKTYGLSLISHTCILCKLYYSLKPYIVWYKSVILLRLPRWLNGKQSTCQCRRHRRLGFNPWVRKIPWRRKWQPTPVFLPRKFSLILRPSYIVPWRRKWQPTPVLLPGDFYGQRSLVGYIVHEIAKNWTQLCDFHFSYIVQHKKNSLRSARGTNSIPKL